MSNGLVTTRTKEILKAHKLQHKEHTKYENNEIMCDN
jgi:hypothetical protein